jgi:hypothetical protein
VPWGICRTARRRRFKTYASAARLFTPVVSDDPDAAAGVLEMPKRAGALNGFVNERESHEGENDTNDSG